MQCNNNFSATPSASVSSFTRTSAHCMTGFPIAINKSCSAEGSKSRRCGSSGQQMDRCFLDPDISVDEANRPTEDIVIVDCGEHPGGANDGVVNVFLDGDMYSNWPIDLDDKPAEIYWWMDAVESAQAPGDLQLGEGSASQVTRNTIANEGVRSFYKGWSVGLLRHATYQTAFERVTGQISVLLEPLLAIDMSSHACLRLWQQSEAMLLCWNTEHTSCNHQLSICNDFRFLCSLVARGGTNIVHGFKLGAMVLISDGCHVQIHTFNLSSDHDSAVMHAISNLSRGTFSFVDAEGSIQDGFAHCIDVLLSVDAEG